MLRVAIIHQDCRHIEADKGILGRSRVHGAGESRLKSSPHVELHLLGELVGVVTNTKALLHDDVVC
jgi:hypothetical protein